MSVSEVARSAMSFRVMFSASAAEESMIPGRTLEMRGGQRYAAPVQLSQSRIIYLPDAYGLPRLPAALRHPHEMQIKATAAS